MLLDQLPVLPKNPAPDRIEITQPTIISMEQPVMDGPAKVFAKASGIHYL